MSFYSEDNVPRNKPRTTNNPFNDLLNFIVINAGNLSRKSLFGGAQPSKFVGQLRSQIRLSQADRGVAYLDLP
jgi:hypothetical protein